MKLVSQQVFLFAAKVGSLEGYLYNRRKVESLDDWVDNIERMYPELAPEIREELAPLLAPVLKRILDTGDKLLTADHKRKLHTVLSEASAGR